MNMKKGKVSIVIPCYNNQATVQEAVMSCLTQSCQPLEVIVVNDGSTDDSLKVVQDMALKFPVLQVIDQPNQGPARARNCGASQAKGEYLVFLDADDKLAETYLAECLAVFHKGENVDIVYTMTEKFEAEEGIWELVPYSPENILVGNCFPISAMISLAKFIEIGMFDEELGHAEDWEMWIRMTARYPNAQKIDKPLFFYRKRATKDSITDLNLAHNYANKTHLYIYNKH